MISGIIDHRVRLARLLLIAGAAGLLVSCSGGTPEATTSPNKAVADVSTTSEATAVTTAEVNTLPPSLTAPPDATQEPFPTVRPTIEGEIIAQDSRTLVASRTEDPNAGDPFTTIRIERNGGPGSTLTTPVPPLIITVQEDGQVAYGDQQGELSQQTLDQMNDRIRAIDFFGVSGDFIGIIPLEGSEDYLYKVTITRGQLTRSVDARDNVMPQELREFIAYLLQTTQQAANPQGDDAAASTEQATTAP